MKIRDILKESNSIKIIQYTDDLQEEYDELIRGFAHLSIEQQKAAISKFGACILIDADLTSNVPEQLIEFALRYTHILYQGSIRYFEKEHDYGISVIALLGNHIKSTPLKDYIWNRFGKDAAIWVGGAPAELMKQILNSNDMNAIRLMLHAYNDSGDQIPQELINTILTHPKITANFDTNSYNNLVHQIFKNNTLLANKWIRYGEKVRNENN